MRQTEILAEIGALLATLEPLAAAAKPGPWAVHRTLWETAKGQTWGACGIEQDPTVYGDQALAICHAQVTGQLTDADAAVLVAARNAVPRLIALLHLLNSDDQKVDILWQRLHPMASRLFPPYLGRWPRRT